MAQQWYGVRTATRQEAKTVSALKEQRFEVYMPASARWSRLQSRKEKVEAALFPGYIFVFCTPDDFYNIRAVEGVHQFVRVMNDAGEFEPMPFPEEALGDLMARQAFGEFDETTRTRCYYKPKAGESAKVVGGKWRGYIAEILSLKPTQRKAVVTLQGLKTRKITLDMAHLDAA